jgi:hypothetical protein
MMIVSRTKAGLAIDYIVELGTVWMPKFLAKRYCSVFVVI